MLEFGLGDDGHAKQFVAKCNLIARYFAEIWLWMNELEDQVSIVIVPQKNMAEFGPMELIC